VRVSEDTGLAWAGPQLTRVGAFLRYSRIESLPQLVNVALGDMGMSEMDGRAPSVLE
jgi:lipopolysaccharide/colanic/teichoic acid biosynthesis glycosyltransferase